MNRPIASPLMRVAVVMLTLAVVLCLVIPMGMGGGDPTMHFALVCCFVLAVAIGVFLLRRPMESLVLGVASGLSVPLARCPTRMARAPDVVALGALLI